MRLWKRKQRRRRFYTLGGFIGSDSAVSICKNGIWWITGIIALKKIYETTIAYIHIRSEKNCHNLGNPRKRKDRGVAYTLVELFRNGINEHLVLGFHSA